MKSLALLLILWLPVPDAQQVPPISLVVPSGPVQPARSVRMKIETPIKGQAPNDWETFSVEWDVTERSQAASPLEDDLDVDSNGLKASVPSGLNETTLKIKVVVTFVYKDYSTRVARDTKFVTIKGTQPGPGPGPVIPPNPGPGPVNPTPLVVPNEQFGMITWTKAQLLKASLSKDSASKVAESFHNIASMIRNGAFATKDAAVAAMAEANTNAIGPSALSTWIEGFLKPLQAKLNPMNWKIKTVGDQGIVFDEIGYGIDLYVRGQ